MIKITNNPIQDVINTCQKLYSEEACALVFVQGLKEKEGAWAITFWPDNGDDPEISIDVTAPYSACVELIAHEFAHVVAGEEAGHNDEWEKIFTEINIAFNRAEDDGGRKGGVMERAIDRSMIRLLSEGGLLKDAPDWLWDRIFDLFTIE